MGEGWVRVYLVYTSAIGVRLQAHKQVHTDLNPTFDTHGGNSDKMTIER